MTTDVQTVSVQGRFKSAISVARKNGVNIKQNVMSCCRGCVEIPEGTVWSFGGQGNAYSWVNDTPVYRSELAKAKRRGNMWTFRLEDTVARTKVEGIYFNHTNVESARIFADAFTAEGFTVSWDGTDMACVLIEF